MHVDGYFALVLTEASRKLLQETYLTVTVPIAHHCTVVYGTGDPRMLPEAFSAGDLGRLFRLRVVGLKTRDDGHIQAVVVALCGESGELSSKRFSANTVPHVTIGTDGLVEPVETNAMLAQGFDAIDGPEFDAHLRHTYESDEAVRLSGGDPAP